MHCYVTIRAREGISVEQENIPVQLAVFDYDGTIIDAQSGLLFSAFLYQRGLMSNRTVVKTAWWGARYKFHLPHEQDTARRYVFEQLKTMPAQQVLDLMKEFHDTVLTRHYRVDALREIEKRSNEGCTLVLTSATFLGIAKVAADYVGIPNVCATRMAKNAEGRFDGTVVGDVVEGRAKPAAVEAWANEHLGRGAWTIAYAYGDHHSDEEMLSAAVRPYAVDPGRTLRRIAKRNGWAILKWS
jgi:HAD superfamily hydrolase (TIGR01490 family)